MNNIEHYISPNKDFAVIVTRQFSTIFNYKLIEILSVERYPNKGKISYKLPNTSSPEPTENIAEAEVFMDIDIKWDGCSNFIFPTQNKCMLHFCGLADWKRFAAAIEWLHKLHCELMESADKSLVLE